MTKWREEGLYKKEVGLSDTDKALLTIITGGIGALSFLADDHDIYWECVYREEESGKEVKGRGRTPEEARQNALKQIK